MYNLRKNLLKKKIEKKSNEELREIVDTNGVFLRPDGSVKPLRYHEKYKCDIVEGLYAFPGMGFGGAIGLLANMILRDDVIYNHLASLDTTAIQDLFAQSGTENLSELTEFISQAGVNELSTELASSSGAMDALNGLFYETVGVGAVAGAAVACTLVCLPSLIQNHKYNNVLLKRDAVIFAKEELEKREAEVKDEPQYVVEKETTMEQA